MRLWRHGLWAMAGAASLYFAWVDPVYAYLDPGTGAMAAQLLLGGIAGALVLLKLYWTRLKKFLMSLKSGDAAKSEISINSTDGKN